MSTKTDSPFLLFNKTHIVPQNIPKRPLSRMEKIFHGKLMKRLKSIENDEISDTLDGSDHFPVFRQRLQH